MDRFQGRVALFDGDDSMLRANAGTLFTRYLVQRGIIRTRQRNRLLRRVAAYAVGRSNAVEIIEAALVALEGLHVDVVRELAAECFREVLRQHVTRDGMERVREHLLAGELVVLASGSPVFIVEELGRFLHAHVVLGSRSVVRGGIIGPEVEQPLCYREGKLQRVSRLLGELGLPLSGCTLYSDSPDDLPLFRAVGRAVVVSPKPPFRAQATGFGWEIQDWAIPLPAEEA